MVFRSYLGSPEALRVSLSPCEFLRLCYISKVDFKLPYVPLGSIRTLHSFWIIIPDDNDDDDE